MSHNVRSVRLFIRRDQRIPDRCPSSHLTAERLGSLSDLVHYPQAPRMEDSPAITPRIKLCNVSLVIPMIDKNSCGDFGVAIARRKSTAYVISKTRPFEGGHRPCPSPSIRGWLSSAGKDRMIAEPGDSRRCCGCVHQRRAVLYLYICV